VNRPSLLDRIRVAQERVWRLQRAGTDMCSDASRRAMNQLVAQLRHASPAELQAINAWRDARFPNDR